MFLEPQQYQRLKLTKSFPNVPSDPALPHGVVHGPHAEDQDQTVRTVEEV